MVQLEVGCPTSDNGVNLHVGLITTIVSFLSPYYEVLGYEQNVLMCLFYQRYAPYDCCRIEFQFFYRMARKPKCHVTCNQLPRA